MKRPGRPAIVWLLVGSLTLAVALTTVLAVLDAALSERTGLRRQVSQLSERTREDGPLLLDDIAPTATLEFLQHNTALPAAILPGQVGWVLVSSPATKG